jgi:ABC-type Na+ transport system ATPase subunit NatA
MAPAALETRGLRKAYGRVVVDDLDLTVRAGEFYALLGPNGAGKTTTLRMACGLLAPDAGEIRIFGVDLRVDPRAAKRLIAWNTWNSWRGYGRSTRVRRAPGPRPCCATSTFGSIGASAAKAFRGA